MRSKHRSKLLDRLQGWRCDSCGDFITGVQAGWVEWLASEDKHGNDVLSGLRLDPLQEFRSSQIIVEGLPLDRLVGPDGLMVLLSLLAEGELSHTEILNS
jgi:hypothetical protein